MTRRELNIISQRDISFCARLFPRVLDSLALPSGLFQEDHRDVHTDLGQLMAVIMLLVRRSASMAGASVDPHKGPTCRRV